MSEIELKFERENRTGVTVSGSYLIDAARRLGVEVEAECGRLGLCDSCAMTVKSGSECLSDPTKAETEQLSAERRKNGERLSCQAKLIKPGEVVIMTKEKEKEAEPQEDEKNEKYRNDFKELPLEKKIAELVRLESIALSETFSFVINSPFKVIGKVMDVMAEFGLKLDEEARESQKPEEHKAKTNGNKEPAQKKTETAEKTKKDKKSRKKKPAKEKS